MIAFDPAAFDPAAFDTTDHEVPAETGTASVGLSISVYTVGQPVMPLAVSVVNDAVFASGFWPRIAVTIVIGGVDCSARRTGRLTVEAAEDSARLATFSLVALSDADLSSLERAPVTIDYVLSGGVAAASYRRFTGIVETAEYSAGEQVINLACRDGWQERPKACTTPAQVEALFSALVAPCRQVLEWSDSEPDAAGYFRGLLDTMPGATAIDASGIWHAIPWAIGAPDHAFTSADIFDNALRLNLARQADLPSAVVARMTHRHPRLHAIEVPLHWDAPPRVRYFTDGLPILDKKTATSAVLGLGDWIVKGEINITQPIPGIYPVIVGGSTLNYVISYEAAQTTCQALDVVMYRRWYQDVDVVYTVTIALGGTSERDESVSISLQSEFDSSGWESPPSAQQDSGIYQVPPVPLPGQTEPTGYEGMPQPWPLPNSALDHLGDLTEGDLSAAAAHLVALATRRAAAARRRQTIEIDRPLDPRFEIGSVLSVDCYGVSATGQVASFSDSIDLDSGDAQTTFTLACPAGDGSVPTASSVTLTRPSTAVAHAPLVPALGVHVGAHFDTPAYPVEADLLGFLCNCLPTSDNYDASKPVYQPQFRIVMPEVSATVRDPLTIDQPLSATVAISGSGITLDF